MKIIVLFGKPGAGKGTQASLLKKNFELIHISTGDVFRYHIANNTELGTLAKSYMDKGELVPDTVTIDMLASEVDRSIDSAKGYIFDGFPRTTAQAEALDELLADKGLSVNATIALEADEDELTARLLERGKSSGRLDDTDERKIRTRFAEYNAKTAPLIAYYKDQDKFHSVNGIGEIASINERLSSIISRL